MLFYWDSSLTQNVTECLYILQKLWQMLYEQQLKELSTRLLKAFTCIKENLTKIFIDFVVNLLSSESCTNLLMITDCLSKKWYWNHAKRWLQNEWLRHSYNISIELMSFYHNSLRLRNSVCEQSVKRICQLLKIVQRVFTAYHSETDEDRMYESECWTLHLYIL
jgi:hypothetical protein